MPSSTLAWWAWAAAQTLEAEDPWQSWQIHRFVVQPLRLLVSHYDFKDYPQQILAQSSNPKYLTNPLPLVHRATLKALASPAGHQCSPKFNQSSSPVEVVCSHLQWDGTGRVIKLQKRLTRDNIILAISPKKGHLNQNVTGSLWSFWPFNTPTHSASARFLAGLPSPSESKAQPRGGRSAKPGETPQPRAQQCPGGRVLLWVGRCVVS